MNDEEEVDRSNLYQNRFTVYLEEGQVFHRVSIIDKSRKLAEIKAQKFIVNTIALGLRPDHADWNYSVNLKYGIIGIDFEDVRG